MSDVKSFFDGLADRVDKSKIQGMNKSFLFNLSGDGGGAFLVKVADGAVAVQEGATEGGDVELAMSAEDFLGLVNGTLNSQMAFLSGKLKIKGDMTLALKLQSIFNIS